MALTGNSSFTLPFPTSANRLWRAVNGRNIKSESYRIWQRDAGALLNAQRPKRLVGPVKVEMMIYPPDKRRRDLDNCIKACLDLLVSHGVIERDDLWIVRKLTIEAGPVRKGDGVVLVKIDAVKLEDV